ncbi:MAG: DUF502 domain-containing protein [Sedimentisphaerales bacterium]|nr:DUF502 domain-containing protein [Sedimentisphaerales bacterium]
MAGRLKSYFFRGLAVLLPTILTIGIFVWGYQFIQNNISVHINRGLVRVHMFSMGLEWNPEGSEEEKKYWAEQKQIWTKYWVDGWGSIAGFLIALIAVCIIGALFASVVGRTLWRMVEKFIMNTPVLSKVYPYVKQVTDFLFAQEEQEKLPFSRVVAVEYPRKGIWSLGLVTGSGLTKVVDNVRKEFLTVLIPTSPTPFTGFVIMVPKKQTMDMDMTIEEAFRFTVSGGVITPGQKQGKAALPKPETEA